MLKAKDIMTGEVISVKKDAPIFEAVELLAENSITGVPVVEDDKVDQIASKRLVKDKELSYDCTIAARWR